MQSARALLLYCTDSGASVMCRDTVDDSALEDSPAMKTVTKTHKILAGVTIIVTPRRRQSALSAYLTPVLRA